METKDINLTAGAVTAIKALQHNCGTYRFYSDTISRLFSFILYQSDEIGMSDNEALSTIRALHCLRQDLAAIAGDAATAAGVPSYEEIAQRVENVFSSSNGSEDADAGEERPARPIKDESYFRELIQDAVAGYAYERDDKDFIATLTVEVEGGAVLPPRLDFYKSYEPNEEEEEEPDEDESCNSADNGE